MVIEANSPEEYLEKLSDDRKAAIAKLRGIILRNIPKGFEEMMIYGSIGYVIPKSIYPKGYHCDPKLPLTFINIASQKNFIALYHSGIYADPALLKWFTEEYPKYCNTKLDMGKSCIRFKNIEKIPFDLIEELVKKMSVEQYLAIYESALKK